MSLIDTFKNALNNRFSDGRIQMRATVYSEKTIPQKNIVLYYLNDNVPIALGRHKQIGLYNQKVQVAVYHDSHEKSREVAYNILEYVNTLRITGLTLQVVAAPSYKGVNPVRSQYVYTIDYNMKGDK